MHYEHMVPATFLERPNRFIAYARYQDAVVTCHVKNTGRCKELLLPGADIFLQHHPDAAATGRKTEYSLISVCKDTARGRQLINLDSQAPNQVAWEWMAKDPSVRNLCREVRFGQSRFDLAFERDRKPAFMEVKGVTLEEDGIARFPDAPTERGVRHLKELELALDQGYQAYVLLVVAMKGIRRFEPNRATHPEFARALAHAAAKGVQILAYDCRVTRDTLELDRPVPVVLTETGT